MNKNGTQTPSGVQEQIPDRQGPASVAFSIGLGAAAIAALAGVVILFFLMFKKEAQMTSGPVTSPNAYRLSQALSIAAKENSLEQMASLLAEGADPNFYGNCHGSTPLFQAYLTGNMEAIELLRKNKAAALCDGFQKLLREKYDWKESDFQ